MSKVKREVIKINDAVIPDPYGKKARCESFIADFSKKMYEFQSPQNENIVRVMHNSSVTNEDNRLATILEDSEEEDEQDNLNEYLELGFSVAGFIIGVAILPYVVGDMTNSEIDDEGYFC